MYIKLWLKGSLLTPVTSSCSDSVMCELWPVWPLDPGERGPALVRFTEPWLDMAPLVLLHRIWSVELRLSAQLMSVLHLRSLYLTLPNLTCQTVFSGLSTLRGL